MSDSFYELEELENKLARMAARLPVIMDASKRLALEDEVRNLEIEITETFRHERKTFEILSRSLR